MLRIASCLLLAVTALEAHRAPHAHIRPETYASSGAVYPIDYNDELTIKNPLVHPDANIIFTFSQTRRDQPPLLDNREERLGKYMYRHRKSSTTTTTTSTTPVPTEPTTEVSGSESEESAETVEVIFEDTKPAKPESAPEEVKPESKQTTSVPTDKQNAEEVVSESMRVEPAQQQAEIKHEETREPIPARRHHGRVPMRSTMLPTGLSYRQPISSFHDFESELELPDSSRIDPAARYPPVDIWQPTTKTTLPPFFTQTASTIDLKHLVLPQVTEAPSSTVHRRHGDRRHGDRRHGDRSRHGDRRADVTLPLSVAPAVPTVSVPTILPKLPNPPPPVPTLSPWYGDSFGK